MILFAIKKNFDEDKRKYVVDESEFFEIPPFYDENTDGKFDEFNIQLISWNQAISPKGTPIANVQQLFDTILEIAEKDVICSNIRIQFSQRYGLGINIIDEFKKFVAEYHPAKTLEENDFKNAFKTVYENWPHPMIENVALSSIQKSASYEEQYIQDWDSFNERHMSNKTKECIKNLFQELKKLKNPILDFEKQTRSGLKLLKESGNSQCRIYDDWTDLARAVIGEISTFFSKMLEEIYALELCDSEGLLDAQISLIKKIVDYKNYPGIYKEGQTHNLENLFRSYDESPTTINHINSIQRTGYIYNYLWMYLNSLHTTDDRWKAFASFINSICPDKPFIENTPNIFPKNIQFYINAIPPTIRSAMVFEAVWQLSYTYLGESNRIAIDLKSDNPIFFEYCYIRNFQSEGLPSIISNLNIGLDNEKLNTWMRDEKDLNTIAHRHYLMPLWAGTSTHARYIYSFFYNHFKGKIKGDFIDDPQIDIANVVLPSMFAFWRLYYNKYISSTHTLAEIYEAIYAPINVLALGITNQFNTIIDKIKSIPQKEEFYYNDAWYTYYFKAAKIDNAFYCPASIMYRVYNKYIIPDNPLSKNIEILKNVIEASKKKLISDGYYVLQWNSNISYNGENPNEDLRNLDIRYIIPTEEYRVRPLRLYTPNENFEKHISLSDPSDRINVLFDKIKDLSTIQLNDKIPIEPPLNPPQCLTDNGIIDFIGGMEFNLVKDDKGKIIAPELKDGEIIFKATVATTSSDTSPSCWSRINKIVPDLKNPETINCTISEKDNSLFFHGEIALNKKTTLGGISLSLKQLVLESGLDSDWMNVCIKASIKKEQKSEDDAFNITLYLPLYQGTIDIYGEYDNGNVVTLSKLFELFGLGTPPKILPGEEKDFGNLGLKRLHLSLAVDAEDKISISDLQFIISTSKPWPVLKGKDKALISITPIFEIDIKDPFKKESRSIYCSATGRWTVSNKDQTETNFDVTLTSELTLYAGLAQGSELQFETIKELFGITTAFPSKLTFTDLSLMADFKSNNYSFSVAASDVYEFKVKNTTLAIKNVSCSLDLVNASFDELKLSGMFQLGKMDLNVCGSYRGEGNFDFMAEAFNDINTADENCLESANYTLGNFIDDIKDTFSWKESKDSFCSSEYLTASIRNLYVAYNSEGHSFAAKIDIENVIKFNDSFSIDDIKLQISASDKSSAPSSNDTEFQFKLVAYVSIFEKTLNLEFNYDSDKKEYAIKGTAENLDFKVVKILELFGINTDAIPDFIRNFTVESIDAEFGISAENKNANEDNKKSIGLTFVTNAGTLIIKAEFGKEKSWEITYETESKAEIKILELDFVGDFIKNIVPEANENKGAYCIKNFKITFSSKDGIILHCKAFDTDCDIPVYQPKQEPKQKLLVQSDKNSGISFKGTAVWKQINKTIFILTIPKIGLGLDGNYVAVLLDASLKISPLTISLNEAGIGISLCNPIGVKFYLSGFGVSFKNDVLSIGGNFSIKETKDKTEYLGSLMIGFKDIGLTAIGKYTKKKDELTKKETASLCICFSLLAPIGGIPAFFVKGIAGGFGYNERLILPPIEKVADYFLVQAAMGGFKGDPLADLDQHVVEENNQYFLTAGLKFSSFEIVNGSLLLTASFGNDLELGLLGMADISVPPNVATSPIAFAQLALKVAVRPSEGVFSAEAQLTNESYILSKKCKLTGGFAAYVWFGENEHSGDFVISLGGYHPSFNRPEHYPRVPRLGLNWQVDEHISIIGEIYFALTPSNLMAGGKLSATYTQGDLKAWFIAYADILMKWKPFAYDITVGASVGASYTIKLIWRKTVSIELSANLHLWGPEVNGTVKVTWYIISFTISFSEGSANNNKTLSWEEFIHSFIAPKPKSNTIEADQNEIQVDSKDVISISLEGIVGKTSDKTKNLSNDVNTEDIDIVSPYQIGIKVISKIPTNEKEEKPHVRPMGGCDLASTINVLICKKDNQNESDITDKFNKCEDVLQNLPAALWGANTSDELNGNSLVNNLCVGKKLSINEDSLADKEFPKGERWIDLAKLRQDNIIPFENSFDLSNELILDLSEYTREEFKKDENDETLNISKNRDKIISEFLQEQGINICIHIDITDFVDKAESLLSEDFMTINEQGEA